MNQVHILLHVIHCSVSSIKILILCFLKYLKLGEIFLEVTRFYVPVFLWQLANLDFFK